jgi:hypothetical protein
VGIGIGVGVGVGVGVAAAAAVGCAEAAAAAAAASVQQCTCKPVYFPEYSGQRQETRDRAWHGDILSLARAGTLHRRTKHNARARRGLGGELADPETADAGIVRIRENSGFFMTPRRPEQPECQLTSAFCACVRACVFSHAPYLLLLRPFPAASPTTARVLWTGARKSHGIIGRQEDLGRSDSSQKQGFGAVCSSPHLPCRSGAHWQPSRGINTVVM